MLRAHLKMSHPPPFLQFFSVSFFFTKKKSYSDSVFVKHSAPCFVFFSPDQVPRRRVSVAVVPKFNLLNIPGQTPATAGQGSNAGPTTGAALPVLVGLPFLMRNDGKWCIKHLVQWHLRSQINCWVKVSQQVGNIFISCKIKYFHSSISVNVAGIFTDTNSF